MFNSFLFLRVVYGFYTQIFSDGGLFITAFMRHLAARNESLIIQHLQEAFNIEDYDCIIASLDDSPRHE